MKTCIAGRATVKLRHFGTQIISRMMGRCEGQDFTGEERRTARSSRMSVRRLRHTPIIGAYFCFLLQPAFKASISILSAGAVASAACCSLRSASIIHAVHYLGLRATVFAATASCRHGSSFGVPIDAPRRWRGLCRGRQRCVVFAGLDHDEMPVNADSFYRSSVAECQKVNRLIDDESFYADCQILTGRCLHFPYLKSPSEHQSPTPFIERFHVQKRDSRRDARLRADAGILPPARGSASAFCLVNRTDAPESGSATTFNRWHDVRSVLSPVFDGLLLLPS